MAQAPPQPVEPWIAAHRALADDPAFRELSHQSRRAAQRYVANLYPWALAEYLEALRPPPQRESS